jgi:PrcB C-terminal
MRRTSSVFILALLSCLGATFADRKPAQREGAVPTRVIVDSFGRACCRESGYQSAVQLVVRTEGDWAAVWKTLGAALPSLPMPAVDFGREMVLVVSAGSRPTGGWSITIEAVERAGDALHVSILESSPGRFCLTTQMLTHPAAAVAVPRLAGPVTFSRRTVAKDCG